MSGSILVIGSPRDPTVRHSVATFHRRGLAVDFLDLDRFCSEGTLEGNLAAPLSLVARTGERAWPFADLRSCYARLVDLASDLSPEDKPAAWGRYQAIQLALEALSSERLVINRPWAGGSNDSKPYQTSLLQRHGFRVPRSCTTNLPALARSFVQSCPGGAIYKSNSGERSVVQPITPVDLERLPLLAACPVFFQERIQGANVRVHVLGDRCHSVWIRSSEVDYRYDTTGTVEERPFTIPGDLAEQCVSVTRALDLRFSGIDFLLTSEGEYYCLEVNPMPGYHGYDRTLRLAISDDLGSALANAETLLD